METDITAHEKPGWAKKLFKQQAETLERLNVLQQSREQLWKKHLVGQEVDKHVEVVTNAVVYLTSSGIAQGRDQPLVTRSSQTRKTEAGRGTDRSNPTQYISRCICKLFC